MKMGWVTVPKVRPGYLGKKRDDFKAKMDREYGVGNWRLAWETNCFGTHYYFTIERTLLMYEDAYFAFICCEKVPIKNFKDEITVVRLALDTSSQPPLAREIAQYAECYDNDVTNVESGLDYQYQEAKSNHYQDVSVRRVLARVGLWFTGRKKELLHIRHDSEQELGQKLSPGRVPFHMPYLVKQPELNGWWNPHTVEAWYQSSKVLQTVGEVEK